MEYKRGKRGREKDISITLTVDIAPFEFEEAAARFQEVLEQAIINGGTGMTIEEYRARKEEDYWITYFGGLPPGFTPGQFSSGGYVPPPTTWLESDD